MEPPAEESSKMISTKIEPEDEDPTEMEFLDMEYIEDGSPKAESVKEEPTEMENREETIEEQLARMEGIPLNDPEMEESLDTKEDADMKYLCDICAQNFKSHQALLSHVKWRHKNPVYHQCKICVKQFRDTFTLKRHCISKHSVTTKKVSAVDHENIMCSICGLRHNKVYFESHLLDVHSISLEKEVLEFDNYEEFFDWKEELERTSNCKYVKRRGAWVNKDGTVITNYNCYRDGYFSSRSKGIRNLKSHGSNKIDGHCPAVIQTKEVNEKITVTFTKTHVGHDNDVQRMSLTRGEKEWIAERIAMKIPIEDILDEIKSSFDSDEAPRLTKTTRKDLHNIIQLYELSEEAVLHKEKKDPASRKLAALKYRHKASLKLPETTIIEVADTRWNFLSSDGKELYEICKTDESCDCDFRCNFCSACIHDFCCSCSDSSVHLNMCKHIHLVCRFLSHKDEPQTSNEVVLATVPEYSIEMGNEITVLTSDAFEESNSTNEITVLKAETSPKEQIDGEYTVLAELPEDLEPNTQIAILNTDSAIQSSESDKITVFAVQNETPEESFDLETEKQKEVSKLQEIINSIDTEEELQVFRKRVSLLQSVVKSVKEEVNNDSENCEVKEPPSKKMCREISVQTPKKNLVNKKLAFRIVHIQRKNENV